MSEGVSKDSDTLMSVYRTLFTGMKGIIAPGSGAEAYSLSELREKMPTYTGTSRKQYQEKMRRKLRRSYEYYQQRISMDVAKTEKIGAASDNSRSGLRRLKSSLKRALNR